MRKAAIKAIYELAAKEERVILLLGDVGSWLHRRFKADFPDRFYNVGIAEANVVGISAGLALAGKLPYIYGISTFMTGRCFDQVRVDLCLQNLPVKIIGVSCGTVYAPFGPTHHSIEDIATMRSLPNMTIFSPCDAIETEKIIRDTRYHDGPVYIRLPFEEKQGVHEECRFVEGVPELIKDGIDVVLLATGRLVYSSLLAAKILGGDNIDCAVINMHTVKPINEKALIDMVDERQIFTVEDHNIIGGLGSAVSEILCENGFSGGFKRIGIADKFSSIYGSLDYLDEMNGLSPAKIAETVVKCIAK